MVIEIVTMQSAVLWLFLICLFCLDCFVLVLTYNCVLWSKNIQNVFWKNTTEKMKEKQNKTKQETHEMEQVTFQICPQLNEVNVRQVKIKGKLSPFIFVFNVERTQTKR